MAPSLVEIDQAHLAIAVTFLRENRRNDVPADVAGADLTAVLTEFGLNRLDAVRVIGRAARLLACTPDPRDERRG